MTRPDRRPLTVLAAVMRWDYGDPARGPSCEETFFVAALRRLVDRVEVVWIDDLLGDPPALAQEVLCAARAHGADLVFFVPFKEEVSFELTSSLKGVAESVAWFGDDQWRFDDFTQHRAGWFDHVVTTAPLAVPKYRELGVEPIVSQWAAAATRPTPPPPDDDAGFEHAVTFVGGASPSRRWFVRQLERSGVEVACWGAGWPRGRLPVERVDEVFRTSRVNLNLSNSVQHDVRWVLSGPRAVREYTRSAKRVEQAKARHFEIPAAGGFQLTHYFVGLEDYFRIGEELALFTSPEDCAVQARRYLADPSARIAVARRGHQRAVQEHTYVHRLEKVLDEVSSRSS